MKADADKLKPFTGRANPYWAQKICDYLQIPPAAAARIVPRRRIDRPRREDVCGRDCYIVQPTSHPVNAHYTSCSSD